MRTSLWEGFEHDDSVHQFAFFDSKRGCSDKKGERGDGLAKIRDGETSSLNTLGYSPIRFKEYIAMILEISTALKDPFSFRPPQPGSSAGLPDAKPFIVSVTGSPEDVGLMATYLLNEVEMNEKAKGVLRLLMEVNLSCPNIVGKEPPAYDGEALRGYIRAIKAAKRKNEGSSEHHAKLKVGIKTPPYTHQSQFSILIKALGSECDEGGNCPVDFITATNTLGSCLLMDRNLDPVLGSGNGMGVGGMAGDAIHALSLGNVRIIRGLLDGSEVEGVRAVEIIGVGGVKDAEGLRRMRKAGAGVVGLATGLGREGVDIFQTIWQGV